MCYSGPNFLTGSMRLAFFHDFLTRMGGAEHVLATMAEAYPEAPVYTLFCDRQAFTARYPHLGERLHTHPEAQRAYDRLSRLPRVGKHVTKLLLGRYAAWVSEMDLSAYTTVIANSTAWGLGPITPVDTRLISYIHSPARYLWDYFPSYKRELGATQAGGLRDILLTRMLSPQRLQNKIFGDRADVVLCNSHLVADRIAKFYRREAQVLYPPVDITDLPCTGPNPAGPALILSTLTRYKNIDRILSWWGQRETPLLIAGDGPDRERLMRLAGPSVQFLGYVSQSKRKELLAEARVILYPSLEDFGLGPVEAMACGKGTIALGQGGARETLDHGVTGILTPDLSRASLEKAWEEFCTWEKHYSPSVLRTSSERFSTETFLHNLSRIIYETPE